MMFDQQQQEQQQYPQPQEQMQAPQQHDPAQQLVEAAFGNGLPRDQSGAIDFKEAVQALLQAGADQPTLRVAFWLLDQRSEEQHQQMQQQMQAVPTGNFGEALKGRPRSSVVGFRR